MTIAALALSGCSAPAADLGGATVDAITVTGKLGTAPKVEMPTPLVASSTQCKTVIAGNGEPIADGQLVKFELSFYNGTTGKLIDETDRSGQNEQSIVLGDAVIPGLRQGMKCASEGARVVMAIPPADAFGEKGNPQWGISATDTIVLVADITRVYLARANGTPQLSQDGMPMVVLAPNGQPGITMPKTAAPADERISTLLLGSGPVVQSGDQVTVHYTGALWSDGTVFDSSWTKSEPAQFVVGDGVRDQGGVIQGFSNGLIGQRVGSQVLIVIPPSLGYGDQVTGSIPANSTLVFVVDILGIN